MNNCVFAPADILLPASSVCPKKWAVIACDQYTASPGYWEEVRQTVGEAPSTANLMLPEAELPLPGVEAKIEKIHQTMVSYLNAGVLDTYETAYILVERTQPDGRLRYGVVGQIDLDRYDYHRGAHSLIRASEATVVERIPARVAVRRGAALEAPHLMLLADDGTPETDIFSALIARKNEFKKLYDFDLMQQAGHLRGYLLDERAAEHIAQRMEKLSDPAAFAARYGVSPDTPVLALAVGDGNHSLASAKVYYEESKNPLARHALAELVSIHSEALTFEPIFRLLQNTDRACALAFLHDAIPNVTFTESADGVIDVVLSHAEKRLPIAVLQPALDAYLAKHPDATLDYIHGESELQALAAVQGNVAFRFAGMKKSDLFPAMVAGGVLPRKAFSMGQADDKRFYMECRKIK